MKTKHTEGNWRNGFEHKLAVVCDTNNGKILTICTADVSKFIDQEEAEANALLISKSPKLLAALEKIKDEATAELHRQAMNNEAIDKLLGAIAELCETTINEATKLD